MNPDTFFASVDERRASSSPYLRQHYGIGIKELTHDEAQLLLPHGLRDAVKFDASVLFAAIREASLSENAVARAAGISSSCVSRVLKKGAANRSTVIAICAVLGIDSREVICD